MTKVLITSLGLLETTEGLSIPRGITLSPFMRVFFIIVTNVITKLKENMILNNISNLYMRE